MALHGRRNRLRGERDRSVIAGCYCGAWRSLGPHPAEGAQVYECKADPAGRLVWEFREPVATLIEAGKTVGRHYAGPRWEHADGSVIAAKLAGRAPGASASDIPLLKLKVIERRGNGVLSGVTTVQRIDTRGGAVEGPCATAGAYLSVPYAADYVFLRKGS